MSRADRSRALALFHSAESKRAEGDCTGAIREYLEAEQLDPGLARVHKRLALCYQLQGDRRRAIKRYERYLASNPEDADKVRAVLTTLR